MRAQQEALKGCFDDLLEARVVGVCCALHVVRFEGLLEECMPECAKTNAVVTVRESPSSRPARTSR